MVAEYANKHEKDIAVKMANLWEGKIGSDKKHSPRTVVSSTEKAVEPQETVSLTKAGTILTGGGIPKKELDKKATITSEFAPLFFRLLHKSSLTRFEPPRQLF